MRALAAGADHQRYRARDHLPHGHSAHPILAQGLPGSILATALWFPSTLAFGWYVTRHAHYRQVYGSLGAGVALLVWLYIILVSVMVGAEFNAQVFPKLQRASAPSRSRYRISPGRLCVCSSALQHSPSTMTMRTDVEQNIRLWSMNALFAFFSEFPR